MEFATARHRFELAFAERERARKRGATSLRVERDASLAIEAPIELGERGLDERQEGRDSKFLDDRLISRGFEGSRAGATFVPQSIAPCAFASAKPSVWSTWITASSWRPPAAS